MAPYLIEFRDGSSSLSVNAKPETNVKSYNAKSRPKKSTPINMKAVVSGGVAGLSVAAAAAWYRKCSLSNFKNRGCGRVAAEWYRKCYSSSFKNPGCGRGVIQMFRRSQK